MAAGISAKLINAISWAISSHSGALSVPGSTATDSGSTIR